MKKTVKVDDLIDYANKQLSLNDISYDEKLGIINMIERVLLISNRYEGFIFLDNSDSDVGTSGYLKRKYIK